MEFWQISFWYILYSKTWVCLFGCILWGIFNFWYGCMARVFKSSLWTIHVKNFFCFSFERVFSNIEKRNSFILSNVFLTFHVKVIDDRIIHDKTVADQVSMWKSSKGLSDKMVTDHTCSGETCSFYQIGDVFVCEKTGHVHGRKQ